ncbi:hypothetical protein RRG08_025263 [Elysia crispata]|uniref:Calponin-homology (CH) domain-containing protein n=1 Tax=Elysia crispata TaxID=231223 RepID=A0AAE1AA22_9GAST|nr:hypothetical protein RRG08_025263 [Elysia crispata]
MSVLEGPVKEGYPLRSPRAMRRTQIYINWVNSVLGEAGGHVEGVEAVQDGKVLCDLIDVLAPDAGLLANVKATGDCTPLSYIKAALDHMKSHGIKIKFPPEDIIHNEIKSLLDILWILILNYGIHFIGQNAFQRSVGIGKKQLLEWCQDELDTTFDHRNTLTFNLCNGDWFVKLLERVAGCSMKKSKDTAEYIDALLTEIQDRYCIMKDIIRASDIVDGTVDEHTLMIYLSLMRRRASNSERHRRREMLSTDGKAAALAKVSLSYGTIVPISSLERMLFLLIECLSSVLSI